MNGGTTGTVAVAHMPYHHHHHLLPVIVGGLLLLSAAASAAAAADGDQFLYNGFTGAHLALDGSATVTQTGLVELTNGTSHQKGHAFHPSPLYLRRRRNSSTTTTAVLQSFSVTFVFGIVSSYLDFSTHGLAFVVAPTTDLSSSLTDQYLGLTNTEDNGNSSNRLLAVELDTVQNVEFSDISANHVGVDLDSLTSVVSHDAGYYLNSSSSITDNNNNGNLFKNLSLISREAMQVWVDYDGESAKIEVTMAPLGVTKPSTPLLSTIQNLSGVLAEPSYVGFSSATGPATNSRHYVLGWSMATDGRPLPAIDPTKLPNLPQDSSSSSSSSSSRRRSKLLETVLPMASAAAVLAVGAAAVLAVRRRRRYAEVREDWETEFGPHRFAYRDLYRATRGFREDHILGAGGFGVVFRGVLSRSGNGGGGGGGGMEVAVKKVAHGSKQGVKEFVAEIVSIGRIRHRNLVRLLGYCRRKDELLLVYDFMPNGSLDKYLHGGANGDAAAGMTLGWEQRFRVIKNIASGLHFLHERWEKVVVHRDVKASNVLLDADMNARLGDFGLAKLFDHHHTGGAHGGGEQHQQQTTRVVGTTGYLAPELVRTGKASTRTDVFAFGTLLLEVTCGRRPIIPTTAAAGEQTTTMMLVDWVLQHWHAGTIAEAVDPRLLLLSGGGGFSFSDEACLALRVGLLCSHPSAEARPTMQQVLQYLDGELPLPEMTRGELSFDMLALVQREGLHVMSCACLTSTTAMSAGTMSVCFAFNNSRTWNTQ